MIKLIMNLMAVFLMLSLSLVTNAASVDNNDFTNNIEAIDFSALSGGRVSIRVKMTKALADLPANFTLQRPARIALDFPNIGKGANKSHIKNIQGALKSVTLAQAKSRTRMVLNLSKAVSYDVKLKGKDVIITLQSNQGLADADATEALFAESTNVERVSHAIKNVDFTRGKNGEGRIIVDLSDSGIGISVKQKGKQLLVDFINTTVPDELQRRLNVINFSTPVLYIDTLQQGENGRIVVEPKGNWEQSAYQTDKKFVIDIRKVIEDPNALVKGSKPGYSGEKLSLNFQDIEVRSILRVIADFTGLNIITSDTVSGNLTLRLNDVPWDQALSIIMENKGLTMRKVGNVITVAPTEEVAAKDKAVLEASRAIENLEPLVTEVFTLKYQKAEDFKNILTGTNSSGGQGGQNRSILSERGSAVWDPRTNTLFIQDTAKKLEEVQQIINETDVPVRQVMIESRLVLADEKFGKDLGARFGVSSFSTPGKTRLAVGGNSASTTAQQVTSVDGTTVIQAAGSGGLNSNLPVQGVGDNLGSLALSLFHLPSGLLLNLELTALESDKRGKVISSPRVMTANQQKAKIAQGTEIPYQQASASGATTVEFKEAVLSLEVTPQITPDDKIIMDLDVQKERVGQEFLGVPSIETQNVKTQMLVANGETAVIGGIYEQTERNDVSKVPFFGDIPIIGNAFKNRSRTDNKTELLIFITPRIMDESLGLQ